MLNIQAEPACRDLNFGSWKLEVGMTIHPPAGLSLPHVE
jgi:hypothetical protein